MIPGAPVASGWHRPDPRRSLPAWMLQEIVGNAFPGCKIITLEPLAGGFRNANFKVRLDPAPGLMVLRVFEHDPSICAKELDLLKLVNNSVPTPKIIHARPDGLPGILPFMFMEYVEGISLRELKRNADPTAIAQAARSAGETLAAVSLITFPDSGWLGPGPAVTAPLLEGADPGPRFIDLCLASANARSRLERDLIDQIHTLVWSYAPQFAELDQARHLVHGDFGNRNLLVQCVEGKWRVAAVLDWEFAISGSPLTDIGHFMRYERTCFPRIEPSFSQGYLDAGGTLLLGWRRLARVVDLIALCESLTHDGLAPDVVAEIVELVRATVQDRDPQLK
jgi:aminoglycoside phosphotransferase (APT) family kinase protein